MPQSPLVIIITLAVIALILILLVSESNLYDKIKVKFTELHKVLSVHDENQKQIQEQVKDIRNLLEQKRPLDLQILQKIMLYLTDEGLIDMPIMIFQEKFINDQHFIIKFSSPHLQLMIEIIAKYTEHDLKTDFPEKAHNLREKPEIVMLNWGEKLKEYFAEANKLLGK